MNQGDKGPDEELASREELRVANIDFEKARSQGDQEEAAAGLERTVSARVKRLAQRILSPPPDGDSDGG